MALLTHLLLATLCTSSLCASQNLTNPQTFKAISSSKNVAPILKHHGKLFFTFTPAFFPTAKGTWRLLIITPDKKTFKGPKISIPTSPASPITVTVKHPIFFGLYTIAAENISVSNFISNTPDLIDGFVTVSNSFNSKTINVAITKTTTNNPGITQEGYFTPFHPFIPH